MKRNRVWFLILLAIPILAIIAWAVARSQNHMQDSDFLTFWLAGKFIITGQDPFDPILWKASHGLAGSNWLENPFYCYPLPLAYLTIPFGIIANRLAAPIWLFFSACSIILAILIIQSRRRDGLHVNQLFPVILGLALFRPVLTTIRNGQLGGFYLLILVASLIFAEKKKWILLGLLSALLYLKPTLGLPIMGLLFIWLLKNNGFKGILANLLAAGSILTISVIHQPGWINSFFSIGLRKGSDVFMITPTIWGVTGQFCRMNSGCTQIAGAILFILIALIGMTIFWKYSKRMNIWLAGSAAILIALLITPYLWAYDQVLLILPILYISNILVRIKTRYIIVSLLPILFSVISLLLLYIASINGHDVNSIILTLITTGVLIWVEILERKHEYGPITS